MCSRSAAEIGGIVSMCLPSFLPSYSKSIGYFLYISAVKRYEMPNRKINVMVNHQE